jgi:iron complex outermembrane receptor protein
MKKFLLSLIILLVCYCTLEAQSVKKDTLELNLNNIVISSTRVNIPLNRIPFSTSFVGEQTIDNLPRGIALDEAVKLVPGIKVDNQANGERLHVSIRGQGILSERGVRGIKILIDGIPVNDPTGFAPDLFDIDFANVQNIEVVRGPAASLYGGGASGGIISVTTKSSPDVPLFGAVHASAGSNNFWKSGLQFGGNVNNVNYNVSFGRTMGDGYRQHTHFWADNLYGKATYSPSDVVSITPIIGWTHAYHENPEGINLDYYNSDPKLPNDDAIRFNEFLETNRVYGGLTGKVNFNDNNDITFNVYNKHTLFTEANNAEFDHRTINTSGTTIQYDLTNTNLSGSLKNTVSLGSDLQWQNYLDYRDTNFLSLEGHYRDADSKIKQSGLGVFLLDNLRIDQLWTLMFSLRYDKINNELIDNLKIPYDLSGSKDFSKATSRVGVAYSPCTEWNLFLNYGQGFLPPATEELSQNPDNLAGFNSHLEAATSNGIDFGARGILKSSFQYDVSCFYLHTDNDFDRYRIPGRGQTTFYKNTGASKRFGLEAYAAYFPLPSVELQMSYTYSHFQYSLNTPSKIMMDDTTIVKYIKDGNWLPNSPQHQIYIECSYKPISKWTISAAIEGYSKSYIDGANIESEAVSGYVLLHARINYDWSVFGLTGSANINFKNITNQKYVAFSEPDPGGNAYQPGAGFETIGGVKVNL